MANVFKKCGKGGAKRMGFRSFKSCVKAGGKKRGGRRKATSTRRRSRKGGILVNGKRYVKASGKVHFTRKQMARKRSSARKAINRIFK
jgi:hypothetical protein|tara:strand:- start:31 stop:294 length:264 start_codon:yes stop_codon:yes gene_type:complete